MSRKGGDDGAAPPSARIDRRPLQAFRIAD
jgi:hypothetical protein